MEPSPIWEFRNSFGMYAKKWKHYWHYVKKCNASRRLKYDRQRR